MKRKSENSKRLAACLLSALLMVLSTSAVAFHDGGSGSCAGCHVMHGQIDGQPVIEGSEPLLLAPTATDLCLMCHGGQDGVFGLNPLDPPREKGAGNFVFLLEDNINDAPDGWNHPIAGEAAGHSIVSLDHGVGPDSRYAFSPGGNFPTQHLGCTSCHDPHGNQNFRLLHGVGPVQGGLFQFTYPAPEALGLDVTSALADESPLAHTAYRSGVSDWCGNCHGEYHRHSFGYDFQHPGDHRLSNRNIRTYNQYNGESDPFGGLPSTAYLPEVPFEGPATQPDSPDGPTTGARLMCLSCHRAHASSAPAAGRWDFNVGLLDDDGLVSGSYALPNPYDDPAQGQLCAKCHSTGPGNTDVELHTFPR